MTRRLVSDERGIALVLAVVTMLVLSSLTASVLFSVTVNSRSAYRTSESGKAFGLAEQGIAYAEGRLYTAATPEWVVVPFTCVPSPPAGTPCAVGTSPVTYTGVLTGGIWTLTATGTFDGITRTVKVQADQPPPIVKYDTRPWNYFYVEGGPTCMSLGGSTNTVNIPIYTHGSMCLNGNAVFTGADLEIGGDLTLIGGNSGVGRNGQPISKMNVVGSCTPALPCRNDAPPFYVTPPGSG